MFAISTRFYHCAVIHYAIAKKLGYSEDMARALGYHRAVLYKVLKDRRFGGKKKKEQKISEYRFDPNKEGVRIESEDIMGMEVTFYRDKFGVKWPCIGNFVIKPNQYTKVIQNIEQRVSPGAYEYLLDKVYQLIESYSKEELNTKLSYDLYLRIRDEYRTKEFFAEILKNVA